VAEGDVLLGLGSSGLHTNGYSLARKIVFEVQGLSVDDEIPGLGRSVADALMAVHRSYLPALREHLAGERIHALAHVTGGGIPGNVGRSLGKGLGARVRRGSWDIPPLFRALQDAGGVEEEEMFRVFNMGVGMIAVTPPEHADGLMKDLNEAGEECWIMGEVVAGDGVELV
jgi:phosphoribosylformylglycinamidine cyclo-ligase